MSEPNMPSDQFPLKPILDLSQMQLDDASRRLGLLLANETDAKERLMLLSRYREEYQARFIAASQAGLSPREWQNFRSFLLKLDDAITQAGTLAKLKAQEADAGKEDWLRHRSRVKAFDTLSQRHQQFLLKRIGQQEQKATDEFNTRQTAVPPSLDE